jgi:hypothetical protein
MADPNNAIDDEAQSQASDESEHSVTLSSTWNTSDFRDNAKAWCDLTKTLEDENREFKLARRAREKRQRELKKNIMEYMHAENTTLNYKGKIFSVEEVTSSNPVNKKKLVPAAEDFFVKRGQSAASAVDLANHIVEFMGEKKTLKLREEVTEEEKVRVKRRKTDELKQKRRDVNEAKRRIADAAARGLPADPNDVAMIQ